MLALRTSEEHFDLPDGASLDVTGSNPAFDPDVVARFFSFPFSLPATPRNLRLLRHANRLDATRRSPDVDVDMWLGGAGFQPGRLRVSSATATRLECVFGNRDRELLDRLQELKIRDILPTVTLDSFVVAEYAPPTVFGSGGTITITLTGDVAGELNDITGVSLMSGPTYSGGVTTWVFDTFETPTIFGIEIHGFLIEENYTGQAPTVAGPAYAALLNAILNGQENLHNYIAALYDTPGDMLAFPTVYHQGLYGDGNPTYDGYVNFWHDGNFVFNVPDVEKSWDAVFVPYVRLKYIFTAIADTLGLAWAGEVYEDADFGAALLFSNYTLDKPEQITLAGEEVWMNGFVTEWKVGNSVPDWSAADYLKRVCGFFNLYVQQQGKTLWLRKRTDQLRVTEPFYDILTDFKVTRTPETGVTLAFQPDDNDAKAGLPNYVIGGGGKQVETELAPLVTETKRYKFLYYWKMCVYEDLSGRPASGNAASNAAPRVFFDRGEQDDDEANPYQMSSSDDTDIADTAIGALSLAWEGETGMYETYWKGWAELQDKEPLEMRAVMPIGAVRRMLRWDRPVIRFYHQLGETRAIVKNIQFEASVESGDLYNVQLEMLKL
jgi:hypothetical protein